MFNNETIQYWTGINGELGLLTEHKEIVSALLRGETARVDLKKLRGDYPLYSIRVNVRDRILFTTIQADGKPCLLLLEFIANHDYQKSRFLKPGVLKKYLECGVIESDTIDIHEVIGEPLTLLPEGIVFHRQEQVPLYYHHQYIVLDDRQLDAVRRAASPHNFPLLIDGPPGSGKTCVALAMLKQCVTDRPKDETLPILYLTVSRPLLEKLRRQWLEYAESMDEHGVPLQWVEFLTYDEWLANVDEQVHLRSIVGRECFNPWWEHLLKRDASDAIKHAPLDMIYQEFCLIADKDKETYQHLGQRQSFFACVQDRDFLYSSYSKYKDHLSHQGLVHPALYAVVEREARYSMVIVDEAQDLSRLQLIALSRRTDERRVAYCIDTHQSLMESHSVRDVLKHELGVITYIRLLVTYRCPSVILNFANRVLAIKNHIRGGVGDSDEMAQIIPDESEKRGALLWPNSEDSASIVSACLSRFKETEIAVIAPEHLLLEARKETNLLLVFSPGQIKGLEFPCIIAYKPLDHPGLEKAGPKLPPQSEPLKINWNRPKSGASWDHELIVASLNRVFVTVTRATEELVVLQSRRHEIKDIFQSLRTAVPECVGMPAISGCKKPMASQLDWEKAYYEVCEVGHQTMADEILSKNLFRVEAADRNATLNHAAPFKPPTTRTSALSGNSATPQHKKKTQNHQKKIIISHLPEWIQVIPDTADQAELMAYVLMALGEKNPGVCLCNMRSNQPSLFELIFTHPKNTIALNVTLLKNKDTGLADRFFTAIKPFLLEKLNHRNDALDMTYLDLLVMGFCDNKTSLNALEQQIFSFLSTVRPAVLNSPLPNVPSLKVPRGASMMSALFADRRIFRHKPVVLKITPKGMNDCSLLDGPNKGMTLLHQLLISQTLGLIINLIPQKHHIISSDGLCAPITGDGENQGKSALYELCKHVCTIMEEGSFWGSKITEAALHQPCTTEGDEKDKTPFYFLCANDFGCGHLMSKFWGYFKGKIKEEHLHRQLSCTGADQGVSPFYALCAHPEGQNLIRDQWLFFRDKISQDQLHQKKEGVDLYQGTSPFFLLAGSDVGRDLIEKQWLFFKDKIGREQLHERVSVEGELRFMNPFHYFCAFPQGIKILRRGWSVFEGMISQEELHQEISSDGLTPFFCLCSHPDGCAFMRDNWSFFSEKINTNQLNKAIRGGEHRGQTPFQRLMFTPEGCSLIEGKCNIVGGNLCK